MIYLRWILYFLPALFIELVCYISAPIIACFVKSSTRYDTVKRFNKQYMSLERDRLIKPLYWFQTHDNAVDEWWYGMYNTDHWFAFAQTWTQTDYDNSKIIRWYCRLMWLWRNCAYGFHYVLFSQPKETAHRQYERGIEYKGFWFLFKRYKSSFQFECHIPIYIVARYISINIGWKAHKKTEKLLYANRLISFRKY